MSKFTNSRKGPKILAMQKAAISIVDSVCDNGNRFKINFSYLDETQQFGKAITKLKPKDAQDILTFCKDNGDKSLEELGRQRQGGASLCTYENYTDFPSSNTKFKEPKNIPVGVHWGRLRLRGKARLAGFTVPGHLDGTRNDKGNKLDKNTFYVVFIDLEHKFYSNR